MNKRNDATQKNNTLICLNEKVAKVSWRVPAKPCRTQYAVKCSLTHVKVTSARAYGIREKRKNDVVINELE